MNAESNLLFNPKNRLKKRILFVVTQSEFGGAQRFLFNLISNLDPAKYEMMLASGGNGEKSFLRDVGTAGVAIREIASLVRDVDIFSDIRAVFELRKLIKNYYPDVLFLNSSKAGFIGSLAAIFPKIIPHVKIIYRIGGWTFNDPWPSWKRRFFIWLERVSSGWKDIIIVNNNRDLLDAKRLGIKPREKIVLVHNGLDIYNLNLLPKDKARSNLTQKIPSDFKNQINDKIIIGTIANFYPAKGLEYLVRAAAIVQEKSDAVFCAIGDGRGRQKIERLIKEYRLKNFFLLGQIENGYRYLPAFDIFVLPSIKEGFSWSLIEAMSAKLPVIAADVGAVKEIIQDGENGIIVSPKSPEQIYQKITELIKNDGLRQKLGIAGHQTILLKFSLESMVKNIEALL